MNRRRRRLLAGVAVALPVAFVAPRTTAQTSTDVHGALDAMAVRGIALAWAILRARDEAATEVVVRVDPGTSGFRTLVVTGVDPFTRATQVLVPAVALPAPVTVRLPRARFADLPRTEWRFHREAAPAGDAPPALLVYYQGVPDTSPEFVDAAKLAAYLDQRIASVRRDAKEP